MKFNLENDQVIFSHLVLQDCKAAEELAETEQWRENGILEAEVKVNGVLIPAEIFEQWMHDHYNAMEEKFKERYDASNFDDRVEERAKELLKEQADGCLDVMYNLQQKLEEADSMLTLRWER